MNINAFIKFIYLSVNFYMLNNDDRVELFLQNQNIEYLKTKDYWENKYEVFLKHSAEPIFLTIRNKKKGIKNNNTFIPINMLSNKQKQEFLNGTLDVIEKEEKYKQKYYDINQIDCSKEVKNEILKNEVKKYNNEKLYNYLILFFNRMDIFIEETEKEISYYDEEKIYISNMFKTKQKLLDLMDIASEYIVEKTTTIDSISLIKMEQILLKSMLNIFFKLGIDKYLKKELEEIYINFDDKDIKNSIQRCCNILKFFNNEFIEKQKENIYVKAKDEEEIIKEQLVHNLLDNLEDETMPNSFKNLKIKKDKKEL